ncbi:hypothetical protein PV327_002406 [Microctonus hyperodae]|uniref:MADF domain-containing protein n=1 Tax=Microctonus hyperodae TaxID=165561 RepID=A0AA39FFN6_MICHY|nr:hypothetical protein PV327_002406 [Microctonus hyperodae]
MAFHDMFLVMKCHERLPRTKLSHRKKIFLHRVLIASYRECFAVSRTLLVFLVRLLLTELSNEPKMPPVAAIKSEDILEVCKRYPAIFDATHNVTRRSDVVWRDIAKELGCISADTLNSYTSGGARHAEKRAPRGL